MISFKRKIVSSILLVAVNIIPLLSLVSTPANAQEWDDCSETIEINNINPPELEYTHELIAGQVDQISFELDVGEANQTYIFDAWIEIDGTFDGIIPIQRIEDTSDNNGFLRIVFDNDSLVNNILRNSVSFKITARKAWRVNNCELFRYELFASGNNSCNISWTVPGFNNPACVEIGEELNINISNLLFQGNLHTGNDVSVVMKGSGRDFARTISVDEGTGSLNVSLDSSSYEGLIGINTIEIKIPPGRLGLAVCETRNLWIKEANLCGDDREEFENTMSGSIARFNLCDNVVGDDNACQECDGVYTALGCFSGDITTFTTSLLKFAIGLAGGIALLFILYGALTISTASGNPEAVQKGQQIVTSAVAGLLFIIFSIVILQIIGVEILAIPEF